MLLSMLAPPQKAQSENFTRIDLTGHPKSQGLSFSIKYPSDWVVREGDRPHIVKKFISNNQEKIKSVCIVYVNDATPFYDKIDMHNETPSSTKEALKAFFRKPALHEFKKVHIEGEKAILYIASGNVEQLGIDIYMKIITLNLMHKKKLINIQCTTAGESRLRHNVDRTFDIMKNTIALRTLNSLILIDRY